MAPQQFSKKLNANDAMNQKITRNLRTIMCHVMALVGPLMYIGSNSHYWDMGEVIKATWIVYENAWCKGHQF